MAWFGASSSKLWMAVSFMFYFYFAYQAPAMKDEYEDAIEALKIIYAWSTDATGELMEIKELRKVYQSIHEDDINITLKLNQQSPT